MWTLPEVLARIERKRGRGSLRSLAVEMQISHAYLFDVLRGTRLPGPKVLEALNLERVPCVPVYRSRRKVKP